MTQTCEVLVCDSQEEFHARSYYHCSLDGVMGSVSRPRLYNSGRHDLSLITDLSCLIILFTQGPLVHTHSSGDGSPNGTNGEGQR